jgi:hypothetical protein
LSVCGELHEAKFGSRLVLQIDGDQGIAVLVAGGC